MIHSMVAHTMEIDDVQLALDEILAQLDLDNGLKAQSIGLISCYSEFIESGVVKALCDALPFDMLGTTTIANADGQAMGHMMLSLMVLTSDDARFSACVSEPLGDDQRLPLERVYSSALANLSEKPQMMICYLPLIFSTGGDQTIALLNEITGNLPMFGSVSVDHTPDYSSALTIFNGEASKDRLAMVLISGDVHPKYFIASISDSKIIKQRAIITESAANVLMQVNDMPVLSYMETLGLAENGALDEGVNSIPFMVDFGDGKLLARAIYAMTPEGFAVCGGVMPVNAKLAVGSIDHQEVMRTTKNTLEEAQKTGKHGALLMFSCLSRYLALGVDTQAEMELVQTALPKDLPYQFSYSGGEVCPIYIDGVPMSRFHNVTFVACIL